MTRTYSQMHRTDKYSQHCSIIWSVWLNGWVFVYELNGCGFESSCSNIHFRFCACFDQGIPWHSGNYRVWIRSKTSTWHDKNIQSVEANMLTLLLLYDIFYIFLSVANAKIWKNNIFITPSKVYFICKIE